jgi:hypothetical protein
VLYEGIGHDQIADLHRRPQAARHTGEHDARAPKASISAVVVVAAATLPMRDSARTTGRPCSRPSQNVAPGALHLRGASSCSIRPCCSPGPAR